MPGFQIYWISSLLYIVTLFHTGTSDGKVQSEQAQNLKLAPCRACKVLVDSFNKVSGMQLILMTLLSVLICRDCKELHHLNLKVGMQIGKRKSWVHMQIVKFALWKSMKNCALR